MTIAVPESRFNPFDKWRSLTSRYGRWLDAIWLTLLAIYSLAGVPLNAFHTDETAHIINSLDYADVFLHGDLMSLPVDDPLGSWRSFTRLLDSTISRYTFGLAWHLAGASEAEVPTEPFSLRVPYEESYAAGRLPSERVLNASRTVSTLFFVMSTLILFAIARAFGPRPLAYLVTALYGLNPVMLINARRAMQEGSLLGFGLLVIFVALCIVRKRSQQQAISWRWWAALALSSGLALLSKNSALLYIASAFGWIGLAELIIGWPRLPMRTAIILGVCGMAMLVLYIVFSPGLWSNPVARLGDVTELRASEMTRLTRNLDGPTPLAWRIENIFTQTYMREAEYADAESFRRIPAIAAQADIYAASPLAGLQFPPVIAWLATVLALLGLAVICLPQLRPPASELLYLGIPLWLAPVILSLLLNPLSFQRYFLPLIPIVTLLTGFGLYGVIRLVTRSQPIHVDPLRTFTAAAIALVLIAVFMYSDQLNATSTAPPVLRENMQQTLLAVQERIRQDGEYAVRLSVLMGDSIEPVTVTGENVDTLVAEATYFCLQTNDGQPICFPYSALESLELP